MKNKKVAPISTIDKRVNESVDFIRRKVLIEPRIGIILGSGLGDFADTFQHKQELLTSDIPNYPVSTVVGHKGKLAFGKQNGVPLLAFQGRIHFYESGNLNSSLYPIRVAYKLGVKTLIITNAAGGVNRLFSAGDLMLITNQINLTFEQPILYSLKMPRVSELYDSKLQ